MHTACPQQGTRCKGCWHRDGPWLYQIVILEQTLLRDTMRVVCFSFFSSIYYCGLPGEAC